MLEAAGILVAAVLLVFGVVEITLHLTAPHALRLDYGKDRVVISRGRSWPRKADGPNDEDLGLAGVRPLFVVDTANRTFARDQTVLCLLRQVRFVEAFRRGPGARRGEWQINLGYEVEGEGWMERIEIDRGATNAPAIAERLAGLLKVPLRR